MPDAAELLAAGEEAQDLCDSIAALLDGQDLAIGVAALFGLMRHVGEQAEPEVRALVCRDLRELADELEAQDAPKH